MCKNLKGYLTVEASFVMPLVIFLYLLIILCGFLLYNRCIISQNDYLVAFRGSRFTEAGINYGEVIYGDMMLREPDSQYVESRLQYQMRFYPFCRVEENRIKGDNLQVSIETVSYGGSLKIKKKSERINIVGLIEGIRCQG